VDELTRLLLAAREGDRAALGEVVARSQPDIWRFCASLVGADGADDATQDTYLRVWQSARTFRAEASAKTWMLAVARRACADALRQRARRPPPTDEAPAAPSGDPSGGVDLRELIGRLEPDRRSAFVLTQLLGLSYRETAEVCDCAIGTVRSRVARARADLAAELRADPASGPGGLRADPMSAGPPTGPIEAATP